MSEDFWINLQLRWDLYKIKSKKYKALKAIKPANFQLKDIVVPQTSFELDTEYES